MAVATVSTGNVVDMAEAVAAEIAEFSKTLPEGFAITSIYDQGYESAVANKGFIWNLIISVATVVAILLFFIGFKNGILVGSGLVFSIFATLIVMHANGIALQRMSLAAIIIAMGMLVDNAIVVSDSALVNMQRGMRKRVAIMRACSSTALPLLAATVIAILTFMPIYYSPHITGELLSSLVIVIGVSLMFSWVFALTQTPFFIQEYVRRPRPEELKQALFGGKGLRPLPQCAALCRAAQVRHGGRTRRAARGLGMEFQVYPARIRSGARQTILHARHVAPGGHAHRED